MSKIILRRKHQADGIHDRLFYEVEEYLLMVKLDFPSIHFRDTLEHVQPGSKESYYFQSYMCPQSVEEKIDDFHH